MMTRRFLPLLFVSLLFSPLVFAQSESSVSLPSTSTPTEKFAFGEKLQLPGIPNAGKISDVLYRGAQPHANGLPELKKLGITTIVDLRAENRDRSEWERKRADSLGIRFVHIPVSGWKAPTDEQVGQFLALFRGDPQQIIFVHCRYGDDRTGVFVATYRVAMQKWTSERTVKEMYYFGFNGFWHPAMKTYIRDFPSHLNSAAALASFRSAPAVP
jgi:tyrosine-protein phosphatase SIW14